MKRVITSLAGVSLLVSAGVAGPAIAKPTPEQVTSSDSTVTYVLNANSGQTLLDLAKRGFATAYTSNGQRIPAPIRRLTSQARPQDLVVPSTEVIHRTIETANESIGKPMLRVIASTKRGTVVVDFYVGATRADIVVGRVLRAGQRITRIAAGRVESTHMLSSLQATNDPAAAPTSGTSQICDAASHALFTLDEGTGELAPEVFFPLTMALVITTCVPQDVVQRTVSMDGVYNHCDQQGCQIGIDTAGYAYAKGSGVSRTVVYPRSTQVDTTVEYKHLRQFSLLDVSRPLRVTLEVGPDMFIYQGESSYLDYPSWQQDLVCNSEGAIYTTDVVWSDSFYTVSEQSTAKVPSANGC